MKKVLKYGTGQEVPSDAEYLCTLKNGQMSEDKEYVWHYFAVDEEDLV